MSTLYFENHEPVIIADGFGFKAPRDWGNRVQEPVDSGESDLKTDFEIDPTSKLDHMIREAEESLARAIDENRVRVSEIRDGIAALDVKALVTSGAQRLQMIEGQRDFKLRELRRIEAETETEIANQKARVARLKTHRSNRRKEMQR